MSIKTDHEGVVLPPGIKLKPLRYKVQLRDCREHRRATLYFELEQTDCNHVCEAENIDEVVTRLETQILLLMNDCMPLRTVKMSSRDPFWMSPLIKHLLKIKARIPSLNSDRLKVINERISKAIIDNRVHTRSSFDIGSYMWWKTTNNICTYKSSSRCTLSKEEIRDLNCLFGQLCRDNDYHQPEPVPVPTDAEAPCVSELQVWRSLLSLKKTPLWIWKDHAAILTPVVTKIWNLSLKTYTWPSSWKSANINPFPKLETPRKMVTSEELILHL